MQMLSVAVLLVGVVSVSAGPPPSSKVCYKPDGTAFSYNKVFTDSSPPGTSCDNPVTCISDPCLAASCPACPDAQCSPNYCEPNFCTADFYLGDATKTWIKVKCNID